jgi:hypothetical protein
MRKWGASLLIIVGLGTVNGAAKSAHPAAVTVRVGPAIAFAPASVRITTLVEPNAANRRLVVVVDSGEHYSSSELPLDGDSARAQFTELKDLPEGEYQVRVAVEHSDGSAASATNVFSVIGREPR